MTNIPSSFHGGIDEKNPIIIQDLCSGGGVDWKFDRKNNFVVSISVSEAETFASSA